MSTKTSIKRIAAVAAVALTLGGFSAVSAHAGAPIVDTLAVSSTAVAATSNVASKVAVTQSFLSQSTDGAAAVTAALISAPAGNTALPTFDTATVTGYTDAGTPGRNATSTTGTSSVIVTKQVVDSTYTAATYNLSFTPVKSGTYVVKLVPTTGTTASGYTAGTTATATAITITYTVASKPEVTAAGSTFVASPSGTGSGNDTDGVTAPKAYTGTAVATILATFGNGSTTAALVNGEVPAITATASIGLVSWVSGTYGKSIASAAAGNVAQTVSLLSDGTSGVATVTFSYTNAAGAVVTLGSKAINLYGTVAKYTATASKKIIPVLGTGTLTLAGADSAGAVTAVPTPYAATSGDTTIATTTIASNVVTVTGVKAGSTTITLTDAATPTVTLVVPVVIGTVKATTLTITTDAASYAPGDKVIVTVTAKDSTGALIGDTTAATGLFVAGGIASSSALQGSDLTITNPSFSNGVHTYTVYAPLSGGTVTLKATTDVAGTYVATALDSVAVSGSFTVTNASADAAQAAVDAANEATDAANAATDAANNAMDSADAAQQAALDAGDKADAALAAVTDLASKVADIATQIAALSSLVSKIAASVAKISAKVKA